MFVCVYNIKASILRIDMNKRPSIKNLQKKIRRVGDFIFQKKKNFRSHKNLFDLVL